MTVSAKGADEQGEAQDRDPLRSVERGRPAAAAAAREARRKRKTRSRARGAKKEKHDREEIFEALEKLGHDPFYQVVDGRDQSLIALARCDADLFFNLTRVLRRATTRWT